MAGTYTEEDVVKCLHLLFNMVYRDVGENLEKLFETLENNAKPERIKVFNIFKIIDWAKAPAKVGSVIKNIIKNKSKTDKGEAISKILTDHTISPDSTSKPLAEGILDIFTAYEYPLMDAFMYNGKVNITAIKLMAQVLVNIILNYLVDNKIDKIDEKVIVDAIRNCTESSGIKKVWEDVKSLCSVSKRDTLVLHLNKEGNHIPCDVHPSSLLSKVGVLDTKKLNEEGELSKIRERELYAPNDRKIEPENFTIRLKFNDEIMDNPSVKKFTTSVHNEYTFMLYGLKSKRSEIIEKLTKLNDLSEDDKKLAGHSDSLENIKDLIQNLVQAQQPSNNEESRIELNNTEHEENESLYHQTASGSKTIAITGSKFKGCKETYKQGE